MLLRFINPVYFINQVFDYNFLFYVEESRRDKYHIINNGDSVLIMETD